MGTYNFRAIMSVKCPYCGNTIERSLTKTPMQIAAFADPTHEMDRDMGEVSGQVSCQFWNHLLVCTRDTKEGGGDES